MPRCSPHVNGAERAAGGMPWRIGGRPPLPPPQRSAVPVDGSAADGPWQDRHAGTAAERAERRPAAHPALPDGTVLLPYPRLFIVATC
jgi:hypothetical protein